MNSPKRRFNTQQDYEPLDLAPAAIMQVVADIAAGLGAVGGLQPCGFTEPVDQSFGFDDIARFDIERQIHRRVGFPVAGGA